MSAKSCTNGFNDLPTFRVSITKVGAADQVSPLSWRHLKLYIFVYRYCKSERADCGYVDMMNFSQYKRTDNLFAFPVGFSQPFPVFNNF